MKFTCYPVKNQTNIETRGLPLLAAQAMFNTSMVVVEDTRKPYPERRFIGYNNLEGRLMVVVFCIPADEQIRNISLRKANEREQ
ncbi:MAG: BrnT family toxin [Methylococcaceae bacterium]|nr:BrnT family toxin [Methylococcaceae bacterium]